jgi:PAS domain S-box-containing protein
MLNSPSKRVSDEDRFRLLIEAVTDYAIYMLDPRGRVESWNAGAQRITGYGAADIIGRPFSQFFTDEDRKAGQPQRALEAALKHERFESEGWRRRKDGSRFWSLSVLQAVRDDRGDFIGFAEVARDMTERRAAQEALRESERRFRLLMNSVIDYAIFTLDREGHITNWNIGAQRIKGYKANEIVGESFSRFYTEEDARAGVPQRALRTAAEQGRFEAEGWRVRKDGSRFWANVVIDAIRDERGELVGFAKVTRDITEQRDARVKLEEAREQLFQAQKMEAIGQLTGGVAHDFNNLLTIILGGADMADPLVRDNDKLKRLIDNMRHAAKRGANLTKQLLAFSRRQPLRPGPVDIAHQLRTTTDLLGRSLRGDIAIVSDLPAELWAVYVDPNQLELALLNVGLNARDAMPRGGTIYLSARNAVLGEGSEPLQGEFVRIEIADTGVGMSDEVRSRAFEPFFTTKSVGQGSGLGLSQAYGFAKQSGGALAIESRVGEGTTVTLHLPAARDFGRTEAAKPAARVRPPPVDATVLVVEDDPSVCDLAAELLGDAGYRVTCVPSAEAALRYLRAGNRVDVVFSDIMMPGNMNGAELAQAIRREFPAVFVLLATGYAEAAGQAAKEFPLVQKPYDRETLLETMERILGEAE